jgi:hypothetical protein
MTTSAADAIRALIDDTERELADLCAKRDQAGLSQFDRAGRGIEASAAALRINAYRRCLRIVTGD